MGTRAVAAEDDGGASSDRGDGKIDRKSGSDQDQRGAALERIEVIASALQLAELLSQIEKVDRAAIDTEADSLHCYREKLCLVQISLPGRDVVAGIGDAGWEQRGSDPGRDHRSRLQVHDYIVDPLAHVDLAPVSAALERKEIVLHGADF